MRLGMSVAESSADVVARTMLVCMRARMGIEIFVL